MRKAVFSVMAMLFVLSFAVTFILSNLQVVAFSDSFYKAEFKKYRVSESTGISQEQLMVISKDIRDYLLGKRDDIDVTVKVAGEVKPLFDRREIAHMKDVKDLFAKGFLVRNSFTVLLIMSVVYFVVAARTKLYQLMKWVAVVSIGMIGIVFILLSMDFDRYFTYFHLIFFNNDLWLLDPSKEMLVNLFPQGFFSDAAFYVLAYYTAELIIAVMACRILGVERRKR
ncbi:TIGR01906 family membrane protein [Caldanaerobius polysaccharolyticus]|uniref:TIGR01906 family membrane protein n=1 Tax=Caldanaerobius polysaccharolyticus TaxID=44256 RepID=UPI00047E28F6|nr:TIGR01906 family membrane protein [Caldanaerobius polysaccharolyticus]